MKLTKREEEIVDGSSIWTTDEEDADGQEELSWGVILFLEKLGGRCHETMFGASIRRRREDLPAVTVTRLKSGDHVKYWCGGYAAVGSRVYRIGGDVRRYPTDCYPKEVYYCNIIEEDGGVLRCGNWEDGPSLSGGKPNPLLVTVNQKIYALAGPLISPYAHPATGSYPGTEKISPLFEVLDGENNVWETLPDPPFKSLYEGDYRGAQILSHTVVGNTIYMFVQSAINPFDSDPKFYSFDIEGKEWKEWGVAPGSPSSTITITTTSSSSSPSSASSPPSSPPPPSSSSPPPSSSSSSSSLTVNLLAYNLGLSDWASSADVVDNKMYVCVLDSWESGTKVFAYDLAAVKDIVPEQEEEVDEPCHDHVVVLPIHGLNHVTDKIPTHFSSGFVTHLVRNTFCLVATYNLHKKNWLRVCAFDVVEDDYKTICPRVRRPLCARNVSHIDYEIEDYVYVHNSYPWCKVGGAQEVARCQTLTALGLR